MSEKPPAASNGMPPSFPPSIPPQNKRPRPGTTPPATGNGQVRKLPPRPEIDRHSQPRRRSIRPAEQQSTPPSFQPTQRRTTTPRTLPPASRTQPSQRPQSIPPGGRTPSKPTTLTHPQNARPRNKTKRGKKILLGILSVPLISTLIIGAWGYSLWSLADSSLQHTDALSTAPNIPGTTYLLAGSDSRENAFFKDDTEGQRSDTIMLVHRAENGQVALISLPRDSFVNIPGEGENKLNASFAIGGPKLLVETIENLTGLTIDHYVEVGMNGVINLVDEVDGVNLCFDYDVTDEFSELEWKAGCHHADGRTALAFARMRYQDPEGDLGRAKRQRQVIAKLSNKILSKETLTSPTRVRNIVRTGSQALTVDENSRALDIAYLGWYFKEASKAGLTGTPPIATIDYETYAGSAVLLDPEKAPLFFEKLASGNLTPEDFQQPDGQ